MKTRTNEISLTDGNMLLKLLRVSVPLILSTLLQLLYNAADLIVCGQFGSPHSVAAISATSSLINLYVNLIVGLSVGANVLMSRCFGANDRERGQKVVYTAMVIAAVAGVFVGVVGATTSHLCLALMDTPLEVIDLSTSYLVIYFCGLPFSMIYNFGSSIMRATGDTKRPFYFLSAAGLVNVGLNLFFVIVCHMDVAGVALATSISQGVSASCILVALLHNRGFFRFRLRDLHFYADIAKEIALIGIPAGIQGMLYSISNVIIQSSVNGFGTAVMDGNGASASLEGFVYAVMNSIAQTASSFVAANYGTKKWRNVHRVTASALFLIIVLFSASAAIVYGFRTPLLGLYISSKEAIAAANERMLVVLLPYFLCGFCEVFAYALRGIGHSLLSMSICVLGVCGLRLFWIFAIFPIPAFHSLFALLLSYPISWFVSGAAEAILFYIMLSRKKRHSATEARLAL